MATPARITDLSSDLDSAVLSGFVHCIERGVKINYCRLEFTTGPDAAAVDNAVDSDGEIVDGDVLWTAGLDRIEVTISGFGLEPIVLASLTHGNVSATNVQLVQAHALSITLVYVAFKDTTGLVVTPNGAVKCELLVIGL